ncbi:hypothetical protein PR048_029201 [Dryococelus australis]|uniref:Uncharacterized protein n=1 Tax=Dryococelus australis TaxID=614101 RepID=A0ABQ9GCP9_9NEOP|nr:hypothetical protein PR048_029201 [Dryococelus australis]
MDNASDYGSEDSRFESWQGRQRKFHDVFRIPRIGPVAQWITRLTTDQKIPGSNPGRVEQHSSKRRPRYTVGEQQLLLENSQSRTEVACFWGQHVWVPGRAGSKNSAMAPTVLYKFELCGLAAILFLWSPEATCVNVCEERQSSGPGSTSCSSSRDEPCDAQLVGKYHIPVRASYEVSTEQCRNARAGETGDLRENPPDQRDDSQMRKSGSEESNSNFSSFSEGISASLNSEVLRAHEGDLGWGNGRSPRKPADQRHRPCENPGVTRQGTEPGSPWLEASRLTAQPPWSL